MLSVHAWGEIVFIIKPPVSGRAELPTVRLLELQKAFPAIL